MFIGGKWSLYRGKWSLYRGKWSLWGSGVFIGGKWSCIGCCGKWSLYRGKLSVYRGDFNCKYMTIIYYNILITTIKLKFLNSIIYIYIYIYYTCIDEEQ